MTACSSGNSQRAATSSGVISWKPRTRHRLAREALWRSPTSSSYGAPLAEEEWQRHKDQWLPSKSDGDYIASLMRPCWERGAFAAWIAPPKVGIDNKPGDFEYVKIARA